MERPNYTQLPNVILDNLRSFTDAELRVIMAICRKTIGYHKDTDQLAHSQLVKMTGLSINSIKKARESLKQKGLITWYSEGSGRGIKTYYDIIISGNNILPGDTINQGNISPGDTIPPIIISPGDTTKERIQRNKIKEIIKPSAEAASVPEKTDDLYHRTVRFFLEAYPKVHKGSKLIIDNREGKQIKNIIKRAELENPDNPDSILGKRLNICLRKMKTATTDYWSEFTFTPSKVISRWNELVDDIPKQSKDELRISERRRRQELL